MENLKEQMTRRQFRIGDLARELKVKKFVIRFWEKEFNLKSDRSQGGQRFYTDEDLNIFLTIKDLLYNQGFTIAGAKKQLPEALIGAKKVDDNLHQDDIVVGEKVDSLEVQADKASDVDAAHQEENSCEDSENLQSFCEAEAAELTDSIDATEESIEEVVLEATQKDDVVCSDKEVSCEEQQEEVKAAQSENEQEEIKTAQRESSSVSQPASVIQEGCIPARAVIDSSFHQNLTAFKEQLTRLYELLS